MHKSSLVHLRKAMARYLPEPGLAIEIGSASLDGEFRAIFRAAKWDYVGADIIAGPNVDLVLADPHAWDIADQSFDAVVSGQMLEHNEMFWLTFLEMARILVAGGVMIHIAPSRGFEHRAPQDCWRFYRDGMRALAKWAGLDLLEATTDWTAGDLEWMAKKRPKMRAGNEPVTAASAFPNSQWGDTVGIFRKPQGARPELALSYMKKLAAKWE